MLGIDSIGAAAGSQQSYSAGTAPLQREQVVTVLETRPVSSEGRPQMSDKQLDEAVTQANNEMKRLDTNLRFSIHERTRQVLVKIVDSHTEEVIREIPPEKLLDMWAFMMEKAGLLVDKRG